ncbi:hypothetical protein, partial [Actinophytocola sp.]|uniref:hypothetical protein n=1 Tax=Actinophytocola sp. TaxID=1872138 RepID=UPI002DDD7DEF
MLAVPGCMAGITPSISPARTAMGRQVWSSSRRYAARPPSLNAAPASAGPPAARTASRSRSGSVKMAGSVRASRSTRAARNDSATASRAPPP